MTQKKFSSPIVPRRKAIKDLGALALTASVLGAACAGDDGDEKPDGGPIDADMPGGWASGTTALLEEYPDPFTADLGSACELTCSAVLGPCYAQAIDRKDISEGVEGLPMRMSFLVVGADCAPIEGAQVDVWHTAPRGLYSGDDTDTLKSFCALNDAEAIAANWFRGVQTTTAGGRADFDSCYPGWYAGRTIHIHVSVRIGTTDFVTTQLYFDSALNDHVLASHPLYNDRGAPDTTNANDGIISSPLASYTFETAKKSNGALHAWKVLVIRSSTASPLCAS